MQGRLKLTKLILAGENKKDAIINFKGGLNVIAGASDTGKSFAYLRHIQMNFVRKLNFYYKGVILLAKRGK